MEKRTNKSPIKTAKVNSSSIPNQKIGNKRLKNLVNIVSTMVFLAIAVYYLPIFNKDYLFKLQDLSLFLNNQYFLSQQMAYPGGLLIWIASFLTQFFYYPWLGTLIFLCLIALMQFMAMKAFKLPSKLYPLTLILSLAFVLMITQVGYMIFSLKVHGYAYLGLLGCIFVSGFFWLYRNIPNTVYKLVGVPILFVIFYPLFGIYGLFSLLVVVVYELATLRTSENKLINILMLSITCLAAFLIPYLFFRYHYVQFEMEKAFTSGSPDYQLNKGEMTYLIPYFAVGFIVLVFTVLSQLKITSTTKRYVELIIFATFLLGVFYFTKLNFTDANFHTEISMDLAIFDNRWEDVVKLAKNQKDEPTRVIVMNTYLALQKLGRAGEELFLYKNGNKPTASPWPTRLIVFAGKRMYYQYGKANYCYHWCMEDWVERGMKVEQLKYMVKCALIKSEYHLAQKYNDLLKQTLFHKDWAEKYQKYLDNPKSMLTDPEFLKIRQLTAYDDELYDDNGALELYLLNSMAEIQKGTQDMFEIALQFSIIIKSDELFWPLLNQYTATHKTIPRVYSEAALFFGYFKNKGQIPNHNYDKQVIDDFKKFLDYCSKCSGNPKEVNMQVFEEPFGKTFWYYYFFAKNIVTG